MDPRRRGNPRIEDPAAWPRARPAAARYGLALALALAEVFARDVLTPAWATDVRLITFSPAVVLAAWLSGMGPGLLATAVCAVGASWWLPPGASLGVAHPLDRVAVVLFVASGALLSGVIGKLHQTRRRAERESMRLARETAARARSEQRLRDVQEIIDTTIPHLGLSDLLRDLLKRVRAAMKSDTATVLLQEDGVLKPAAWEGPREEAEEGLAVPVGQGIAGRIAISTAGLLFDDLAEVQHPGPFFRAGVRSLAGVALRVGERHVGVLHVGARSAHRFANSDLLLLRLVADRVALAIQRARLMESEREARAAADAANRAKDESLAILGHEIRSPLAAITTAIHVLDHSGTAAPDAARLRQVIIREAEQLARMGDDLLDLGRMTAGKIVLQRRPLELADAVRRCLDTLGAAGRTGEHLIEVEAEPVWIAADPVRLEQVAVNLLVNALKYTPAGGVIRLTVKKEAGGAVFCVQDSGAGIAPEVLPHVFEMFVQEGRTVAHSSGGVGIGLAVVRRLVELHGGTVQATSEGPGRGSTFTVRLPALPAGPSLDRRAPAKVPAGRPLRVVVVEDDRDAREALRLLLEQWGNEVYEAGDGLAGVDVSRRVAAEVVFIDLGLPGLDGFEVARRIRGAPEGRDALLVALTGYGRTEDRERTRAAGFDVHLVKPIDLTSLGLVFGSVPQPRVTRNPLSLTAGASPRPDR